MQSAMRCWTVSGFGICPLDLRAHNAVNSNFNQFRDLSWEWYGKLIGRGFRLWGVMKSAAWIGGTQESQECTWWLLDDEKWWLTAPNFDSQASLLSPQNMCPSIGEAIAGACNMKSNWFKLKSLYNCPVTSMLPFILFACLAHSP